MQRWIKPVIIGLAGLFIVMLGFSLLLPDHVMTSKWATSLTLNQGRPFISGFSVEKRNPSEDSVQVVWYIVEELKWYPWEKFYGMMAADMKGPLMDASLQLLKTQVQGRR